MTIAPVQPWHSLGITKEVYEMNKRKKEAKKEKDYYVKKDDEGKSMLSIVPYEAIAKRVAKCMVYGRKKYGSETWPDVPDGKGRYTDAMLRHLFAYLSNPDSRDSESGELHIDHFFTNAFFLAFFLDKEEESNDSMDRVKEAAEDFFSMLNDDVEESFDSGGHFSIHIPPNSEIVKDFMDMFGIDGDENGEQE